MTQKLEDEQQLVVERARNGDEKAWAALFNKYIGRLKREVVIEIFNKGARWPDHILILVVSITRFPILHCEISYKSLDIAVD